MGYLSRRADVVGTGSVLTTVVSACRRSVKSPDCLVTEPTSVTLVEAFFKSCLELQGTRNHSPDVPTGPLSLHKRQGVPAGDGSVVEQDA